MQNNLDIMELVTADAALCRQAAADGFRYFDINGEGPENDGSIP
jgi:hypothetical protein